MSAAAIFVFNTLFLCIAMIGIGATTNHLLILKYMKKPKAYATGVVTQLLVMPLISWMLTSIFQMQLAPSLSVVLQGCSPGGMISNIVVLYAAGNVELSIAMTVTTTFLALGFMPLWVFIFSKHAEATLGKLNLQVPFDSIGITVATLVFPIIIGMIINYKLPEKAGKVAKIMTAIGAVGIVVMVIVRAVDILGGVAFEDIWSWELFVVALLMPFISFLFGLLAAEVPRLFGRTLTYAECRTIAIEISMQNGGVAAAVITNAFAEKPQIFAEMMTFPLFYLIFQVGESVLLILAVQYLKRLGYIEEIVVIDDQKSVRSMTKTADAGKNDISFIKATSLRSKNVKLMLESSVKTLTGHFSVLCCKENPENSLDEVQILSDEKYSLPDTNGVKAILEADPVIGENEVFPLNEKKSAENSTLKSEEATRKDRRHSSRHRSRSKSHDQRNSSKGHESEPQESNPRSSDRRSRGSRGDSHERRSIKDDDKSDDRRRSSDRDSHRRSSRHSKDRHHRTKSDNGDRHHHRSSNRSDFAV